MSSKEFLSKSFQLFRRAGLLGYKIAKDVIRMRIRFGYVAMALNIIEGSPNKTVTYTALMKTPRQEDRLEKLRKLTAINLERCFRVLKYNRFHHIHVFRFTSKLIPLATHPITAGWNYIAEFEENFREIGAYVREHNMRVSFHPDHFTLLNSPNEEVVQTSIDTLLYHVNLLEAMGLGDDAKLILHIGGTYKNKDAAKARFIANFKLLAPNIKRRIILENDDKSFTANDTLDVCGALGVPMVMDVHHHDCCNEGERMEDLWPRVLDSWRDQLPKIHFSSPKPGNNIRAHADFIDAGAFHAFLEKINADSADFDVMIEAKQKDQALFQLMKDLKERYHLRLLDDTTLEV